MFFDCVYFTSNYFFFEEAKMDYNIKSLTISAQAVPKIQLEEYQLQ